ncbi:erythromycin esterase family protein [Pontibacter burrus]|uniref:Erythromycin esterase family protein n=1 Tax=Pontibacter burrus TaxID=2704466 RepID=A0A6B3LXI7_9BACT|nr:erythromycin esterase family protein [Pontibacter burrus]NEM99655.1 erythromycin esterase family protein [Pontibacter burrus]
MKTKLIVSLLSLVLLAKTTFAQTIADRVAYVKTHATIVENTEPTNENYSDLAQLKSVLKDTEIVGLGEQTHYDGSTFKAKTRLVKFLHQELGYEVIAFESGFYDTYKAWQEIQKGKQTIEAARNSVYPLWITAETEELFKYIDSQKNSDRPLILAGIDCKFSGAYSTNNLLNDFEAYLKEIDSEVLQDTAQWSAFGKAMRRAIAVSDYFTKPGPEDTVVVQQVLHSVLREITTNYDSQDTDSQKSLFWQQFCRSTLAEVTRKFSKDQVRDKQMGDNLVFLKDKLYKDKKVIVWAASSHLTYNGHNIDREFYQQNLRLGDYIKQAYGDKYYNIGFTGYRGKIGKLLFFHLIKVKKHKENSIEYVLGQTEHPYLFLDLNRPDLPTWLQEHLVARLFGYQEIRMKLPQIIDGLFYTKEIFQSNPITRTSNEL